jgi:hypothetical protein
VIGGELDRHMAVCEVVDGAHQQRRRCVDARHRLGRRLDDRQRIVFAGEHRAVAQRRVSAIRQDDRNRTFRQHRDQARLHALRMREPDPRHTRCLFGRQRLLVNTIQS